VALQISAPLRYGGLSHASLTEAAYLSSAALTQAALCHGHTKFRPFDKPLRANQDTLWSATRAAAPDLWSPATQLLNATTVH
jgi:hypothetical protein